MFATNKPLNFSLTAYASAYLLYHKVSSTIWTPVWTGDNPESERLKKFTRKQFEFIPGRTASTPRH